MSKFGRKMGTSGWCTFALLGGVLAVAFGAFANASPWDKAEATLVPAAEKAAAFTMIDHAAAVVSKREAASSTNKNKKRSSPTALSEVQAGSSATLSTAQPGAASAASLTEAQQPRGNKPSTLSGTSLSPDATRSAMGGGVDWDDDFESYPDGNCMHGDGGWEGWGNDPTWDACLQEVTWHSSNSAVDIDGNADLVRVYSSYTSGVWNYCTWQYIPDNFSGLSYFILLNTYPAFNWSTQISFSSTTGLVNSEFENASLPMITGQWVQLCVEIDLDADIQTITYDGVLLSVKSWTDGVSGGGALNIGAVDLFANGASSIYYDDFTLIEKEGGGGCGDGNCDPGENNCNCPADCGGECASCTIFNSQAAFEAFNQGHGKLLKGIEDFEETPPGAGIVGFPDPLCGGIPQGPFPNGLDQLNLCVQANILAGAPDVPSPSPTAIGLVFVEFGSGFGESSDIVLSNYFADSFDIMFGDPVPPDQQDNHTGVGFDVVSIFGGGTAAIRVFDKDNVELVSTTSPADAAGSAFWGVWCSSTIGRINVFDTDGGAQGADNIQMWLDELVCQSDDECDDGDACTEDICDPENKGADDFGCVHNDISASCNDGDVCNGEETCDPAVGCVDGVPLDCNDDVGCTDDACDPADGCSNTPNDGACNDGDVCNGEETCDQDKDCQPGTDLDCNDGVGCTDDACDPADGCSNTPNDAACDDGDVCNGEETCDPDKDCQAGEPLDCDDGESCTADSCDPETGCVHEDVEQTLVIKQGASGQGPDCNAPVNANGNGVLPILLVGTGGFDVHDVDQGSLDLHLCGDGPSGVGPIESHTKFKDLNHPTDLPVGCPGCQCNDDESSDGIDDLSMKFSTNEVVTALGLTNGAYTLELTGTANGVPFCARDCILVMAPGSDLNNATIQSNVSGTMLEVTPMDLNWDIDGFADFTRSYIEGTTITLLAPSTSNGHRFLRWSVNGEMQAFGIRTIEVTISEDMTLKAFYQRPGRVLPELPTEGSGDME